MKNIFVFCAGEQIARANYRKTILNPIPEEVILSSFPAEKHAEVRRWQKQADGFFGWGIKTSPRRLTVWRALEPGDCVLGFFDFHYRSVSSLIGKAQNDELAEKIWGRPKDGLNWGNIIFVSRPREIAVAASAVQPYLCSTYRGAARISSEKIARIVNDFGSVDAFIVKSFGGA